MWSCSSCCEKFWCICAASWASMAFPHALFRSEDGAGVTVYFITRVAKLIPTQGRQELLSEILSLETQEDHPRSRNPGPTCHSS